MLTFESHVWAAESKAIRREECCARLFSNVNLLAG